MAVATSSYNKQVIIILTYPIDSIQIEITINPIKFGYCLNRMILVTRMHRVIRPEFSEILECEVNVAHE